VTAFGAQQPSAHRRGFDSQVHLLQIDAFVGWVLIDPIGVQLNRQRPVASVLVTLASCRLVASLGERGALDEIVFAAPDAPRP